MSNSKLISSYLQSIDCMDPDEAVEEIHSHIQDRLKSDDMDWIKELLSGINPARLLHPLGAVSFLRATFCGRYNFLYEWIDLRNKTKKELIVCYGSETTISILVGLLEVGE